MIQAGFWEFGAAYGKWPVPGSHQLWKGKTEQWHSSRLSAKERGEPIIAIYRAKVVYFIQASHDTDMVKYLRDP